MTRVRIRQQVIDAVILHASREVPNECCGLLLGLSDRLDESYAARNLSASPTRFLIDPADHFAAIRHARATGRTVRGAYHSHPRGPSVPSPTDAVELNDSSLLQLIVSLEDDQPHIGVFEWRLGNFVAVDLVREP